MAAGKIWNQFTAFLKKNTRIQEIVDFGGHQVFKSSTVDTCIVRFEKGEPAGASVPFVNIGKDFDNAALSEYARQNRQYIAQPKLNDTGWTLADGQVLALKEKIEKMGTPLKDWDVKIYRGILTGLNEAFIIDTPTKERFCAEDPKSAEILKPILRGRDIGRYSYEWKGLWIIAIESGWTNKNRRKEAPETYFKRIYPTIHRHLKQIGDGIMSGEIKVKGKGLYQRDDQGDYWWELRPCDYYREFEGEKIIYGQFRQGEFALDSKGCYLSSNEYMIISDRSTLKYFLAILNSKLAYFYQNLVTNNLANNTTISQKSNFLLLPIPRVNSINFKLIEHIKYNIDQILKTKNFLNFQDLIDLQTYKVYALDYSEIKIIDTEFKLTETEYENWRVDFDGKQSLELTEKRPPAKAAGVEEQKKVG